MSISTNEPLITKKLCPNLAMSAVPHTDPGGIYHGEAQSIWVRTGAPLSKEQRQHIERLGVILNQPRPAYSQGSSFVYTAELQPGANLKAFLSLRDVLQVRGSDRLEPLKEQSPARSILEELKITSGAPVRLIEILNSKGVAQKAQRILLGALEDLDLRDGSLDADSSPYKDLLADTMGEVIVMASLQGRGGVPRPVTSTRTLADVMKQHARTIRGEEPDHISLNLAQDLEEIAEQLRCIAE